MGFSIGGNGYIGTGSTDFITLYRDFWEYEPNANTWSRKADFGGSGRVWARAFAIGGKGYGGMGDGGTGDGGTGSGILKDFWEYTPGDSGGSGPCISPAPGLVSWWTGDRTADDLQGTNNGVLRNGASFRAGKVGPGFRFDGIDDYVRIPDDPSLNPGTNDFSVNFWMKTDTLDTALALLNKRDVCNAVSFWSMGMARDGTIVVEIYQGLININTFSSDMSVNDGIWHHVALVRQTTTATLYIDGAVHGSGSTEGITIVANTAPVRFATDVCVGVNGQTQFYSGELDEIQYLNVALTSYQVQDIYNAGAEGQCKPEIFVASIDPSFRVRGNQYLISTSVTIQDVNGIGIEGARAQIKTRFPDGQVLTFPVTTDQTGQGTLTFSTTSTGLYEFKVRKVTHPTQEYDASLNIETSDTLLIP